MTPKSTDIAIVLAGGGAWGAAQAASLTDLVPGILPRIKAIYGNSAGAINACLLGKSLFDVNDPILLMTAWDAIVDDENIYSPGFTAIAEHPALHPIAEVEISHGALFGRSAFSTNGLKALAQKYLGTTTTDDLHQKLEIELLVRGYDSAAGFGRVYSGMLWHMAVASSAIEVAFPTHLGVSDGGPVDNAPVDLAINAGFQRILMVYCGPEGPAPNFTPVRLDDSTPDPGILARSVGLSVLGNITLINETINEERLKLFVKDGGQVIECYPAQNADMGSILDFSTASRDKRFAAGRAAAALALEQIKTLGW